MFGVLRQNNSYVDERSSSALPILQRNPDPWLKLPEGPTDNKAFDPRPRLVLTQILTTFEEDSGKTKLG